MSLGSTLPSTSGAAAYPEREQWAEWLLLSGFNPITVDQYKWVVDKLLRKFPDVPFAEITERHVMAILAEQPERSRQTRRGTFQNWFDWGYRFRLITDSPMERVPTYRRKGKPLLDLFTDAEVKVLCALDEPDGTLMSVLFETGIRKAEARNLTVRRCRLADGELHVVEGAKNSTPRIVPLLPRTVERLAGFFTVEGLNDSDFLWYSHPGGAKQRRHWRGPIAESTFQEWWRSRLERAGVGYRKVHTTRHTYATEWRRRGLAMDEVQILLGHADPKTTAAVYVHTSHYDVARRMEALVGN